MDKKQFFSFFIQEGALAVGEDEEGLVVFTTKRPSKKLVSFSAFPVKIIQLSEPFKAYDRQKKIRPLQGGISIGHRDIGAGTLSLIVKDKETNQPLLLSNNHVLANVNRGKKGDPIFQPAVFDAQEAGISLEVVGTLERFVPLTNNVTVDAAVASLNVSYKTGLYGIYPEVRGEIEPQVNLNIQKSGRTTDTTYGTIIATNVEAEVYYDSTPIKIRDCFAAKIQAAPGDSGSLITTQGSEKKVIGLLFAGSSRYVLGCKWSNVKRQLNIELLEDIRPVVLDISHHNGLVIDTEKLKTNKVTAVYLKCTQGDYHQDSKFHQNWQTLKNAGIKVAPYIFVDPLISAQKHFEFFVNTIGDKIPDLPVMLDCEYANNQSKEKITSVIQTLAELIDRWQDKYTHLKPLIYTRASWWNEFVLSWSGWKDYGLWVARYGVDLPWFGRGDKYKVRDWDEWLLWQYSADENNDGARYGLQSRAVDKNIMSEKFIQVYLENQTPTPPEETTYPYYGKVLVNNLRIRTAPNLQAPIVGYLSYNQRVGILSIEKIGNNTWAKLSENRYSAIEYNGQKYIQLENELPQKRKGKVLVNGLRIRTQPNINGEVIGYLYQGNIIDIEEEINFTNQKWAKIGNQKYCAIVYQNQIFVQYV